VSKVDLDDLKDFSMLDLFRMEVETQSATLTSGLLALERDSDPTKRLAELMRAAHSLKGAARIVGRKSAVRIAHAMEDCFVAAQKDKWTLDERLIDTLLKGIDFLNRIAQVSEVDIEGWEAEQKKEIEAILTSFSPTPETLGKPTDSADDHSTPEVPAFIQPVPVESTPTPTKQTEHAKKVATASDRALRVSAENLNCLMGLAGEALLASRWVETFARGMLRLKQTQHEIATRLEGLRDFLSTGSSHDQPTGQLIELRDRVAGCQQLLAERLSDLDLFDRRFVSFSTRLYDEVLECRMRPFADGIQ